MACMNTRLATAMQRVDDVIKQSRSGKTHVDLTARLRTEHSMAHAYLVGSSMQRLSLIINSGITPPPFRRGERECVCVISALLA